MKDDGALARAFFDFRVRLRIVRELRTVPFAIGVDEAQVLGDGRTRVPPN